LPVERLRRLESQLSDLKRDIADIDNSCESDDQRKQLLGVASPLELTKQIDSLQKQVYMLHLESIGANKALQTDKTKK
jgi:hypothetical protein